MAYGSGGGSLRCYLVEARGLLPYPTVLTDGTVLDREWRRVRFGKAPTGVKVDLWCPTAVAEGYFNYSAAQALASWFLANAESVSETGYAHRAIGLEVRLVQVEFAFSFSAKELGVGPSISRHDEQRLVFTTRSEEPVPADAVARTADRVTG